MDWRERLIILAFELLWKFAGSRTKRWITEQLEKRRKHHHNQEVEEMPGTYTKECPDCHRKYYDADLVCSRHKPPVDLVPIGTTPPAPPAASQAPATPSPAPQTIDMNTLADMVADRLRPTMPQQPAPIVQAEHVDVHPQSAPAVEHSTTSAPSHEEVKVEGKKDDPVQNFVKSRILPRIKGR